MVKKDTIQRSASLTAQLLVVNVIIGYMIMNLGVNWAIVLLPVNAFVSLFLIIHSIRSLLEEVIQIRIESI